MKRGELYRVRRATSDESKDWRVYVVVSRQAFVDARSSSVVCAPVYTTILGLSTEVPVGPEEGLKHASAIQCDRLVSIDKRKLTSFVGTLGARKLAALRSALRAALDVD